jgi:biopolymer transport protein ExbD
MSFLSEAEVNGSRGLNLAPMIDFLFLMVVFFATLAVSRVTTQDTEIDLVKVEGKRGTTEASSADLEVIQLTVTAEGTYKWVTELHDYPMSTADEIGNELRSQYRRGGLSEDKSLTKVMLRIDKEAQWESVMKVIFAVRDEGFSVHPVYLPENAETS